MVGVRQILLPVHVQFGRGQVDPHAFSASFKRGHFTFWAFTGAIKEGLAESIFPRVGDRQFSRTQSKCSTPQRRMEENATSLTSYSNPRNPATCNATPPEERLPLCRRTGFKRNRERKLVNLLQLTAGVQNMREFRYFLVLSF